MKVYFYEDMYLLIKQVNKDHRDIKINKTSIFLKGDVDGFIKDMGIEHLEKDNLILSGVYHPLLGKVNF